MRIFTNQDPNTSIDHQNELKINTNQTSSDDIFEVTDPNKTLTQDASSTQFSANIGDYCLKCWVSDIFSGVRQQNGVYIFFIISDF